MSTPVENPQRVSEYFQRFNGGIPKITDLFERDELDTFSRMLCDDLNKPKSLFAQYGQGWAPLGLKLPIVSYSPNRLIPIAIAEGMNVSGGRGAHMSAAERGEEMATYRAMESIASEGRSETFHRQYPVDPPSNNPTIYLGDTDNLPFLVCASDLSFDGSRIERTSSHGLEELMKLGYPVLASGLLGNSMSFNDGWWRERVLALYKPTII